MLQQHESGGTQSSTAQQQAFFEHHAITVDPKQALLRIDKFLMDRLRGTTRNKIQLAIGHQLILVNQQPTKASYQVHSHDIIWLPNNTHTSNW